MQNGKGRQPQPTTLPAGFRQTTLGIACPGCTSTMTIAVIEVQGGSSMLLPGAGMKQVAKIIEQRCMRCEQYYTKEDLERIQAELIKQAEEAEKAGGHDAPSPH